LALELALGFKFKNFKVKTIASAIDNMTELKPEHIVLLPSIVPTKDQMGFLDGIDKVDEKELSKCDKFYKHIQNIPNLHAKIEIMVAKLSYEKNVKELSDNFDKLERAIKAIRASCGAGIADFWTHLLAWGNMLNRGIKKKRKRVWILVGIGKQDFGYQNKG